MRLNDQAFVSISRLISLVPGRLGDGLRGVYYRRTLQLVGSGVYFPFGVTFSSRSVIVGDNVRFGVGCSVSACSIGNDVLFSQGVVVMQGKNQHALQQSETFRKGKGNLSPPQIGQNVWLGTNAVVAASISNDCVVGACSFVNKDLCQPRSMYGGVPARWIKAF